MCFSCHFVELPGRILKTKLAKTCCTLLGNTSGSFVGLFFASLCFCCTHTRQWTFGFCFLWTRNLEKKKKTNKINSQTKTKNGRKLQLLLCAPALVLFLLFLWYEEEQNVKGITWIWLSFYCVSVVVSSEYFLRGCTGSILVVDFITKTTKAEKRSRIRRREQKTTSIV